MFGVFWELVLAVVVVVYGTFFWSSIIMLFCVSLVVFLIH